MKMSMIEATRTCLSKYAQFNGRAQRAEYWWFVLFATLGAMVLSILDAIVWGASNSGRGIFSSLFQLALFVPLLAAAWRRLHDTGRPGWYILMPMVASLIYFVVILGSVALFGILERHGTMGGYARGGAGMVGGATFLLLTALQLGLAILMVWWLTRPSDPGPNAYGPAPV